MSRIEKLVTAYTDFVSLPWETQLAGPQKIWFAVYDPTQERRLRLRIEEFQLATEQAGHAWRYIDISDSFAHWMSRHKYRDQYFRRPKRMDVALNQYANYVADLIIAALRAPDVDANTVVAVGGLGSLFGLVRASTVLDRVTDAIAGRLLVFFPGQYEDGNYRLLDARDGWNYLAIPIT